MNPHEAAFERWMDKLKAYLQEKRGRSAALARGLGVGRQSVSRWFIGRHCRIPAWAAVTANVWYWKNVSPQVDNVRGSADIENSAQPVLWGRTGHYHPGLQKEKF
jgi:hypothetical protein